jgi:putative transposase
VALVRYIHLNPVRSGLVPDPDFYPYSGHQAYLTPKTAQMRRSPLIHTGPVLGMLGGPATYRRFVRGGIGNGSVARYYQVEDQQFLGAPGFAQRIRQQTAQSHDTVCRKPLADALEELSEKLGLDVATLRTSDRSHPVATTRAIVGFVLVRRLGFRLTDVAAELGRDTATLSVTLGRLATRMRSNDRIRAAVARLGENV